MRARAASLVALATGILALLVPASSSAAQLIGAPERTWQPNGPVNAIEPSADGSRAFIGGDFDYVGPVTGSSVRLGGTTATPQGLWPSFEGGTVTAIESAGPGNGWFVAGSFTKVNGQAAHARLVHVHSTGLLDQTWGLGVGPNVGSTVTDLEFDGTSLFAVGGFLTYDGVAGSDHLARINPSDGSYVSFPTPFATFDVLNAVESDGTYLYVGGEINAYDHLLRLNIATGAVDLTWVGRGTDGEVKALELVDTDTNTVPDRLYVGGAFTKVNRGAGPDLTRPRLAAIDLVGAPGVTAFNPNIVGDAVRTIAYAGGSVYAGGDFSLVNGATSRPHAAKLDDATGADQGWAPSFTVAAGAVDRITSIAVDSAGDVYVGGRFTKVNGVDQSRIARFAGGAATPTAWNPMAGGAVRAIAFSGSDVLLGGEFASVNGKLRSYAAAIELESGELTSWKPNVASTVFAITQHQGIVYLGGDGAGANPNVTAVRAYSTGTPTGFAAPALTGGVDRVWALEVLGDRLFIGGDFSTGPNLVSVDLTTTGVSLVGANGPVRALESAGGVLYVGGSFTTIASNSSQYIAKLGTGGAFVSWSAALPTGEVHDISVDASTGKIYLAGAFGDLGSQPAPRVGALLPSGAADIDFDAIVSSSGISAVAARNGIVAAGGQITYIGGQQRNRLGALTYLGGDAGWGPELPSTMSGAVNSLAYAGSDVLVGGVQGIAIFRGSDDALAPHARVSGIEEALAPGNPLDNTHALNSTTIVVRTDGVTPHFDVTATAYDRVPDATAGYDRVSGVESVQWPALTQGTWSAPSTQPGRPRGLVLRCWNGPIPTGTNAGAAGIAIDRQINYAFGLNEPAMIWNLPGSLAASSGSPVIVGDELRNIGCRWQGHLVTPEGDNGGHSFESSGFAGFRLNLDAPIAAPPTVWPTIDMWNTPHSSSMAGPFAMNTADPRPFTAEWKQDSASGSAAVLRWDTPTSAGYVPIPEGAFVTGTTYTQRYSLLASVAQPDGIQDADVQVRDRRGNVSPVANTRFRVIVDNSPPVAPTTLTSALAYGFTTDSAQSVSVSDATIPDPGAGFYRSYLEYRTEPLSGGACTGGGSGAWTAVATYLAPGTHPTYTATNGTGCHQYRYRVVDLVGNEQSYYPNGIADDTAWIKVDTSSPVGGSIAYATGTVTGTPNTHQLNFDTAGSDAQSNMAAQKELQVRTATIDSGTNTCGAAGSWGSLGSGTMLAAGASTYAAPITAGLCYEWRLVSTNAAGGWADATGGTLMVDAVAPSVTMTTPATNVSGPETLSGTSADAHSGVSSVRVEWEDSGGATGDACPTTTGTTTWSCNWNTGATADGVYSLRVIATDAAGNVGTATRAGIIVDNTPPVIDPVITATGTPDPNRVFYDTTILPPSQDVWVSGQVSGNLALGVEATDSSGVLHVAFPGITLGQGWTPDSALLDTVSPYAQVYSWTAGTATNQALVITAADNAGGSSTHQVNLRVDSASPSGGSIVMSLDNGLPKIDSVIGTDVGAQIERAVVLRETATASGTTCGTTWSPPAEVGPVPAHPTWTDTGISPNFCYRYSLKVEDHVGNTVTYTPTTGPTELVPGAPALSVTPSVPRIAEGSTFVVNVAPTTTLAGPVTVQFDGAGQFTAVPSQLTFTNTTALPVTVTAIDDAVAEPAIAPAAFPTTTVQWRTIAPSTLAYVGVVAPQVIEVPDNDTAGFRFSAASTAAVEGGAAGSYGLALTSKPNGNVTVKLGSGTQAVAAPSSMTFTPANWNAAQTVTVTAVNDPDIEGAHASAVTHDIDSAPNDTPYASLAQGQVAVSIGDDDAAGLDVQSSAQPAVDEANAATQETVRVRLKARPSGDVSVSLGGIARQLSVSPAVLTFSAANWDQYQSATVIGRDDMDAEPSPHVARLGISVSSGDANFAAVAPSSVEFRVADDDVAAFTATPGGGWTLDDDGHLRLSETATDGSILRIRAVGDPLTDVTITPVAAPADQLEITPKSFKIPAGSHLVPAAFTVRAVNDRTAEGDPHPATITWKVTTSDPLYGATNIPTTVARITDGADMTIRETTDTGTGTGTGGTGSGTDQGTTTQDTNPNPGPTPTPAPENQTGGTTDPDATTNEDDGALVGDDGSNDTSAGTKSGARRSAGATKTEPATRNPAKRIKNWAKENKGKASVAASAAGTGLIWAAKPLALAGKALASGGGLPHTPPGMTQLRHLLKLRKKRRQAKRLGRFWRGKSRTLDHDDDDWDDFLWGDRAA